jgi:hypothetical protein
VIWRWHKFICRSTVVHSFWCLRSRTSRKSSRRHNPPPFLIDSLSARHHPSSLSSPPLQIPFLLRLETSIELILLSRLSIGDIFVKWEWDWRQLSFQTTLNWRSLSRDYVHPPSGRAEGGEGWPGKGSWTGNHDSGLSCLQSVVFKVLNRGPSQAFPACISLFVSFPPLSIPHIHNDGRGRVAGNEHICLCTDQVEKIWDWNH